MSAEIPEEALRAVREHGLEVQSWDPERRILTVGQGPSPVASMLVYADGMMTEVARHMGREVRELAEMFDRDAPPLPVHQTNRHERRKAMALARRRS